MDPESEERPRTVIFNKYEMGRVVGQGSFAKVYHGRNLSSNESVAIKVIKKEKLKKERLAKQIKREVSVMRLVKHPHIVQLKELMANKAKIFLVMEYVKGGELFSKLAQGKLPEDLARKYFRQLISAVDFCHSRGVTHRDLKPENLLLDENQDLKVTDFGLSALPEQRRADGMLVTPCGTPAYVAPEVLKKKGYEGSKADIWSCGVILYALLCGYLPFEGENVMGIYRKAHRAQYRFPEWISPEAKDLISNLLVADPDKRYSVSHIMRHPWWSLNCDVPPVRDTHPHDTMPARPFYNAFEIISSLSPGFGLCNLFETRRRSPSLFLSKHSASAVLAKVVAMATDLRFTITASKDFTVKLEGPQEGRKGRVAMTVEVFEVAPEVAVVEFSKSAGDTLEYINLCQDRLRPSLNDIVWSWQGQPRPDSAF